MKIWGIVLLIVLIIIGYYLYKNQSSQEKAEPAPKTEPQPQQQDSGVFYSVAEGEIIPIDQVNDEVFSQKMMGDGFAVRPQNGEVVSPVDGKVLSVFPTKHAVTIESDHGAEVLVHMGIDTVELEGAPFTVEVTDGQRVKAGQPLATMDLAAIKESGRPTDIIVAFTNSPEMDSFNLEATGVHPLEQSIGNYQL